MIANWRCSAARRRVRDLSLDIADGESSSSSDPAAPGIADARVHHVENHGVEKIVTLRAGGSLFKATMPAISQVKIEDPVRFALNQDKLHGFDPQSGLNRAGG